MARKDQSPNVHERYKTDCKNKKIRNIHSGYKDGI